MLLWPIGTVNEFSEHDRKYYKYICNNQNLFLEPIIGGKSGALKILRLKMK